MVNTISNNLITFKSVVNTTTPQSYTANKGSVNNPSPQPSPLKGEGVKNNKNDLPMPLSRK